MEEKNNVKDATGAEETGKLVTQEDVSRIVSERLGKERDKAKKELQQHEESRSYYKTVILTDMPKGRGKNKNCTDEYLIKRAECSVSFLYRMDSLWGI